MLHTDTYSYTPIQVDTNSKNNKCMSSNMAIPKICVYCGGRFISKTTVTKFCGRTCRIRFNKNKIRNKKILDSSPVEIQRIEFEQKQLKDKIFLSIAEASQLLGASRMTIHRQIKAGVIKATKIGRRTIIQRSSIDNLFTL